MKKIINKTIRCLAEEDWWVYALKSGGVLVCVAKDVSKEDATNIMGDMQVCPDTIKLDVASTA